MLLRVRTLEPFADPGVTMYGNALCPHGWRIRWLRWVLNVAEGSMSLRGCGCLGFRMRDSVVRGCGRPVGVPCRRVVWVRWGVGLWWVYPEC